MSDPRAVSIHGKTYMPVSARVEDFRNEHGTNFGMTTEIVENTENRVVIKASIISYGIDSAKEQRIKVTIGITA